MLLQTSVNTSLKAFPALLQALFNMGNMEREGRHFEAALECYRSVLELQPGHWRSLLHSAVALLALQRADEAHAALKQAVALSGAPWLVAPKSHDQELSSPQKHDQEVNAVAAKTVPKKCMTRE